MRLIVLASGSSGNAALIESGGRGVLLDAGISCRETLRRLASAGAADVTIDALLLTHEHVDHVAGARVLARRLGVPVIATRGTLEGAARYLADVPETIAISRQEAFDIGGMKVRSFPTPHDGRESCCYTFSDSRGTRIGVATDSGTFTAAMAEALEGCAVLGLEANHDERMLAEGPYPWFLKQRISGERGHLSNAAAAAAIERLCWSGLSHVFALHLSEQNNTPTSACSELSPRLGAHQVLRAVARYEVAGCEV